MFAIDDGGVEELFCWWRFRAYAPLTFFLAVPGQVRAEYFGRAEGDG